MGQTSISSFCAPLGRLWVGSTNKCTHTHTHRELRDSLTQKLYFKTHLAGSMAVSSCTPRVLTFTFTPSLWPITSWVGSGERKEVEAAGANHSEMAFLSGYTPVHTKTFILPFLLSLHFFSSSTSSSSGAVWVCADSRGRGGERHPESASSVKASHPPPSSRSLSTGFLSPLKTDISLCPSFSSLCFSLLCLLFTSIYTVYLWMSCQISHLDP